MAVSQTLALSTVRLSKGLSSVHPYELLTCVEKIQKYSLYSCTYDMMGLALQFTTRVNPKAAAIPPLPPPPTPHHH